MNFEQSINKILHEAYFSSPYEKATGIKRQVNITKEEYNEPAVEFDYDEVDQDDEAIVAMDAEQEYDKFMDEGDEFIQKVRSMSQLRGTKLRKQFGLTDVSVQALEKWIESGSPEGKPGVDLLINAFLDAKTGVMLMGDEVMTHELQRVTYALAFATGLKNEQLIEREMQICNQLAPEVGLEPTELFERRWSFHFQLDPNTSHPQRLSKEEKAQGITTKRQGKPLMSGERFRKILEGGQLKAKKAMDVQKPEREQEMGDIDQARANLSRWRKNPHEKV